MTPTNLQKKSFDHGNVYIETNNNLFTQTELWTCQKQKIELYLSEINNQTGLKILAFEMRVSKTRAPYM